MGSVSELQIDLRQTILAIETAVDLVGMNDNNHGKRVGYIASQIAHQMDRPEQELQFVFELGLLHDCGVSTEQMHSNLVNHFDWEDVQIHCEIGFHLLKDFEPLGAFATPILYHHTPWSELGKVALSKTDAFMANLIFLADRVDVMAASHYESDVLLAREDIVKTIQGYSGSYFDPAIVDAFCEVERSESFWIALEERHITRYTWDMGGFRSKRTITLPQLKQLSLILAYIVDQKSPFTAQHSERVGVLARFIADACGLPAEQAEKIEIAGYLHDLGKLRMPDMLLEKTGALTRVERAIMSQHSYETYEILRHIDGLEEIAIWAAYHHEGVNGSGYPFHPQRGDLSIEARIIAVADIFQALVQDRPYRPGMQLTGVLSLLQEYVSDGRLDPAVVEVVIRHGERCFALAQGDLNKPRNGSRLAYVNVPLVPQ